MTSWVITAGSAAAADDCVPDSSTGCIAGTIRTAAGDPAEGVELTATGPAGELSASTDDTGAWAMAVEEAGTYEVSLDEATLPEGETLRQPENNPRTVEVELGSQTAALFPLGEPEAGGGTEPSAGAEPTEPAAGEPEGEETAAGTDEAGEASESAGAAGNNRVVQLIVSGLTFGLLLAMAAVGANLIYGTTGLSNFAHGDLVTLGGLVAFTCVRTFGLPLWLGLVVAVLVGGVAGFLLDAGIFGRLRRIGVGTTQQLIVTIGISLAAMNLFLTIYGGNPLPIVGTISERINFGLFSMSMQTIWLLIVAVIVLGLVTVVLQKTRLGRATRAVSDNSALAAASGINVNRIIRGVWVSAAMLAALGGALLALYLGSTRFNFGQVMLLLMFAAITLGGLGSPLGGILGAIVIGLVVELSTLILPNDVRYATALVILIVVLLFRPQGILGRAQRIG
ncbi:ABC transporter permease subunit [Naumannella halotolerans]|nr:branched-chain amino acid ABC transporter permease [Naumannella halotolerans]